MAHPTAPAHLRTVTAFVLLSFISAGGPLAAQGGDAAGATPIPGPDPLRDLVVQVAATNVYKPFSVLIAADDGTAAALGGLLDDPQLTSRQRFVAAVALSYVRTPAALAVLLARLSEKDSLVLRGIVMALGYFRDDSGEVHKALTQLAAEDPTTTTDAKTGATRYPVREGAQAALGRLAQAQPLATPATQPPTIVVTPAPAPTPKPAPPSVTGQQTPAAVAASPGAAALPPPVTNAPACLSVMRVEGTWQQLPESTGRVQSDGDGRLNLTVPAGGLVSVRRAEPLPSGPWTLDLWRLNQVADAEDRVATTLTFGQTVSVELAAGKWNATAMVRLLGTTPERGQGFSVYHARGPVQWLQLSYTPDKTLEVRLNGVAMPPWRHGAIEVSTSPVTLTLTSQKNSAVQIASCTVGPYGPITPPPAGLLHGGWSAPPRKLPADEAASLISKLQGYAFEQTFPCPARTYALAALALVQCAQDGQMADGLWQRVPPMQGSGADQVWLMEALPLLLACSSPAQRAAAAPHVQAAITELKHAVMAPNISRDDVYMRTALFAPAAVADALSRLMHEIEQPRMTVWLEELAREDPCMSFTLWNSMPTNTNDPRFHAWLGGRLRPLIPNYSRLLLDCIPLDRFPDYGRCYAAVEIARTDRPAALLLFEQIKNVTCRVAVAPALGMELPAVLPPSEAAQMEGFVRNRVLSWQPSRSSKAPVWPMLELAEFLKKQGRTAEAEATLRDMAAKVSALPEPSCHDILPVARGMAELQLPEAEAWLDQAVAAARAQDQNQVEPAIGSGEVYISATWQLVRFLCDQGLLDRALAVTRTLNPETVAMNYNNCLVRIIKDCAPKTPERVRELLPQIVPEQRIAPGDRQVKVIGELIETPAIAESAWPEQWINLLPPDKRLVPTVRLALARGKPLTGDLQEQFGQMLNGELKYTKPSRGEGWSHRGWALRQLEPMTLAQVQQYERYLIDDPDFYCYQLLNALIRETGLAQDPIWRIWKVADQEQAYQLPWELSLERLVEIAPKPEP